MTTARTLLCFLALPAAAAAEPVGPAGVAPAPSALVDQLMAALPESQRLGAVNRTADPGELRRLSALNPGKAAQVQKILEDEQACISPASNRITQRLLREAAAGLGEAKLEKLIEFYRRPDFVRLATLAGKPRAELSAAEAAEMDGLFGEYPLAEFAAAMSRLSGELVTDTAFSDAMMACAMARQEALEREQLREY